MCLFSFGNFLCDFIIYVTRVLRASTCSQEVSAAGLPWVRTLQISVLYVGKIFVSRLQENKVHCYLTTRPEVESFRDLGFVLQIYMKQKALEFRFLWLLKIILPSKEPDISFSVMNSKHTFILTHYVHTISLKHSSVFNTDSNDVIRRYIEHVRSRKRKIASEVAVRGAVVQLVKGILLVYTTFIPGVSAPCY